MCLPDVNSQMKRLKQKGVEGHGSVHMKHETWNLASLAMEVKAFWITSWDAS
jgi:hypothetical protein